MPTRGSCDMTSSYYGAPNNLPYLGHSNTAALMPLKHRIPVGDTPNTHLGIYETPLTGSHQQNNLDTVQETSLVESSSPRDQHATSFNFTSDDDCPETCILDDDEDDDYENVSAANQKVPHFTSKMVDADYTMSRMVLSPVLEKMEKPGTDQILSPSYQGMTHELQPSDYSSTHVYGYNMRTQSERQARVRRILNSFVKLNVLTEPSYKLNN